MYQDARRNADRKADRRTGTQADVKACRQTHRQMKEAGCVQAGLHTAQQDDHHAGRQQNTDRRATDITKLHQRSRQKDARENRHKQT